MSESNKIPAGVLPLFIAGLVAALGWWGNERLRATIEGQLRAQLATTLNANVTALGIWTTNQLRLATSLAGDPTVQTLASDILTAAPVSRRNVSPPPDLEQFDTVLRPRFSATKPRNW